ncbi:Hypothetical_protein [Hexamita inflata]|uniref:Hypothetical_protein n=1 Tax=Hexamita inflata TaxID=28002 RepID=A0AA86R7L0_9EUKA|nr:Hypothetical protein HINF_LOCUS55373 [Hexamita inflata]
MNKNWLFQDNSNFLISDGMSLVGKFIYSQIKSFVYPQKLPSNSSPQYIIPLSVSANLVVSPAINLTPEAGIPSVLQCVNMVILSSVNSSQNTQPAVVTYHNLFPQQQYSWVTLQIFMSTKSYWALFPKSDG